MPHLFLRIFLVLSLIIVLNITHVAQAQRLPAVRYATPGGAATGEVVQENDKYLQLDVRPCAAERVILIFRRPYTKDPAGTIQCGGVTKALVQVIQR
jgi:hypothetical protein